MLHRILLSMILLGTLVLGLQVLPERADAGDDCPELTIDGEKGKDGTAHFVVDVIPGVDDVTFNWTVSDGGIESGQGTSSIIVAGMGGGYITATVEIGDLNPGCPATISKTVTLN